MLGGCSVLFRSPRQIAYSGDAVATNRVTQMIDPWPVASGRRNIAYSGERRRLRRSATVRPCHPANATQLGGVCSAAAGNPRRMAGLVANTGNNNSSSPTK
jgi:hypothetical protein